MLVRTCSAQKHHFNDIIVLDYWDINPQSYGYVISINIVMHNPDQFHALNG